MGTANSKRKSKREAQEKNNNASLKKRPSLRAHTPPELLKAAGLLDTGDAPATAAVASEANATTDQADVADIDKYKRYTINIPAPDYEVLQKRARQRTMSDPDYPDECPDLIKPKKLMSPLHTSPSYKELTRELIMNQKQGVLLRTKPELQKVMEQRRRDQHFHQRNLDAQRPKSMFDVELLKRYEKIEQTEKEREKAVEDVENGNVPEFVKVKERLRPMSMVLTTEQIISLETPAEQL
ncbi:protein FAM107B [Lethenteron reissneri]|uniref:protein FAM107B n=1 Tax=Lethenteron reissneri TaxID=7753 RepID=UPI002AB649EC|nr:protein FAM107B [Lethenteron reissneri]